MRVAICDDNISDADLLEGHVKELKIENLSCDVFHSGEEVVTLYAGGKADYDVVFVDMEMKKLNGIQTANAIRKFDTRVFIIFVTNFDEYMKECFECLPFRFFTKPIKKSDIENAFKVISAKISQERTSFLFTENREVVRLFSEDIIFFEKYSHWVYVHTSDRMYKTKKSISALYREIDRNMFAHSHKSYIVNMKYIKFIKNNEITLYSTDRVIPISRSCRREFESCFMNFRERRIML